MYSRNQPNPSRRFSRKHLLLIPLVVVLVVAALELSGTTYLFRDRPPAPTATPETKGEPAPDDKATEQPSTGQDQPADRTENPKSNTGTAPASLKPPTGTFVSNHRPNLSGSPAPNKIASVCTTTPGATCVITFTKDGVSKSLPEQTTDRGGSTYWNWRIQDIGLTEGAWRIEAVAKLGNQTQTASDAINMEIAP